MNRDTALLVIDVQNDFLPGGALAVPKGDEVIAAINRLARDYDNVLLTQDWHPRGHVSFASSHRGRQPFDTISLDYGEQVLWPDHCVQGTEGAAIAYALSIPHAQGVIRKGYHLRTDSYSAFVEADRKTPTGLAGLLRERGISRVVCCGLATDYCVAWSALDAVAAGFAATVCLTGCRAIDNNGSLGKALARMSEAGVVLQTDHD